MTPNQSPLKIGVVGLGKMGIMHACLLNTMPNVEVQALCDKSRLIRTIAKRSFKDATVTDSLDKFADLNLDAIYMLTPIPIHYPLIKQIYTKKLAKHIFVEKTLTSNYNQSAELSTIAQTQDSITMVGYMKRFSTTFNQAKQLLEEQAIGKPESFKAYAFSSDFANTPKSTPASNARGGVIEDLGSHIADLAVWFFGDLTVTDTKINSQLSPTSEDDLSFNVTTKQGLPGHFDVSWCKQNYRMPEFNLSIQGTTGNLDVNDDEVKLTLKNSPPKHWYRHDMNDNVGFLLGGPEYYRENQYFIQSILSKTPPESNFKNTLSVDYLLEQVRRQSK
ncbi:MAG: Gfo/Idh/MocA family oxidoreductase [Nitrososphaerota archaeon]|jgi:predicted dehydrogenase|nr:Gfo/Idh/MocA family oxidoreductase [Nitrososphaerota archaeon]